MSAGDQSEKYRHCGRPVTRGASVGRGTHCGGAQGGQRAVEEIPGGESGSVTDQPYDLAYWGPGGIDLSRWGPSCRRGCDDKSTGAPVAAGTAGVVRKISTGRKSRGLSSDDYRGPDALLS